MTTIEYDSNENFRDLLERIKSADGTPIEKLLVLDLATCSECVNGVYIFTSNEKTPLYVGKAQSQSFAQRIGIHFDTRTDGAMGTILKRVKLIEKLSSPVAGLQFLKEKGARLTLLIFGDQPIANAVISKLERYLIRGLDVVAPNGYNTVYGVKNLVLSTDDFNAKCKVLFEA